MSPSPPPRSSLTPDEARLVRLRLQEMKRLLDDADALYQAQVLDAPHAIVLIDPESADANPIAMVGSVIGVFPDKPSAMIAAEEWRVEANQVVDEATESPYLVAVAPYFDKDQDR